MNTLTRAWAILAFASISFIIGPSAVARNHERSMPVSEAVNAFESGTSPQELVPPEGSLMFGQVVAVSGDWAVIGDTHRHVYLAKRDSATRRWQLAGELRDAGVAIENVTAVAILDDVIALGVYRANQVLMFRRDSGSNTWSKEATLSGAPGSNLGTSLALSRTPSDLVLAAGSPGTGALGSVAIYRRAPAATAWDHETNLLPPASATYNGFGQSVALDGNRLIAGCYWETHSNQNRAGAAYVYERSEGGWHMTQRLTAGASSWTNGWFGTSVAISGDNLAVGHIFYADVQGAVHPYTFDEATATWIAGAPLREANGGPDDQKFGFSLALSDSRLVVGAVGHDLGADFTEEGAAFIYTPGEAGWVLDQTHKGTTVGSALGASVAVDGETILVGAPSTTIAEDREGRAYAFDGSIVELNQHSLTGGWYNPATAGQGFMLEVYPDIAGAGSSRIFGGWYTYDAAGVGGYDKQRWYVVQGDVDPGETTATLGIHTNYGGNFDAPPVTSSTQVGTATLSYESCTRGTLTYTFTAGPNTGRSGVIPLTRLLNDTGCAKAIDEHIKDDTDLFMLSGSWFEPATSGQGMVIEINPSSRHLFAGWFTYAPNGQSTGGPASQRWYTLQAPFTTDSHTFTDVPIYGTTGGVFDTSGTTSTEQVGRATLVFQSCSAATLSYTFTAGPNAGRSGTIDLSRTGPAPSGCNL